jgi:eukaryotic-like serine/threonine-protein kinase
LPKGDGGKPVSQVQTVFVARGNAQRTGEYRTALHIEKPMLAWQYQATDRITSPPIVVGNRLFLTTNDGYVGAVSTTNGHLTWHAPSYAVSPGSTDGKLLLAWQNLQAVELGTMEPSWMSDTEGDDIGTSPLLDADVVYFGSVQGNLYAATITTGQVLWSTKLGGELEGDPAIDRGVVYIEKIEYQPMDGDTTREQASIHALDADTGSLKWSFEPSGAAFAPIAQDGRVYCIVSESLDGEDHSLVALDSTNGAILWKHRLGGDIVPPLAVSNGLLVAGTRSGVLTAVDAASGDAKWERKLGDFISSGPSVADNTVYIGVGHRSAGGGEGNHYAYALDLATSSEKWRFETAGIVRLPIVLSSDSLYITDDRWILYAIH